MFRRVKREVCFLVEQMKVTGLCAFLCCMGGILLWVSGGSQVYLLRGGRIPIGVWFLLWLLVYGLTGIVIAWALLTESCYNKKQRHYLLPGLCASSYILMLCWYAVFFCTRLLLFSQILLLLSIVCMGAVFVYLEKGIVLARAAVFFIETGQILCLVYCFFMNLSI